MESSERVAAVQKNQNNKKDALYYGGRKADKLVRCYWKEELGVDRVELELHSGLLRGISTLDDFLSLPDTVYPKHLQFVDFNWTRLEQHLSTRPADESSRILAGAKRRSASLRRVRRYLNMHGVVNIHRFLVPLPINDQASRALDRWARHFKKGMRWVRTK